MANSTPLNLTGVKRHTTARDNSSPEQDGKIQRQKWDSDIHIIMEKILYWEDNLQQADSKAFPEGVRWQCKASYRCPLDQVSD